jgi:predicted dehydrogenase
MLRKLFRVKVYRSVGALGNLQFDAVFVLTPPSSHFSIAKEHLLDGKHIFLEKPMTLSPEESYELLNLAKKKKVQFSCGYVYRHHPIYREIKRIVSNGVYGSPMACKIAMRGNVVKADSPVSWRRAGKGSGCLYDYGCHVIDLSIFLFGKPGSVECLSKEELFQTGVVDRFSVELNHNEFFDVQSCITCDWADQNVRKAGLVLEISTNDHFIFCDGQTIAVSGATSRKYSIKDLDSDVGFYLRGEEFQRQTDEFFLSIANSTFSYLDAEDAVTTDAIILEIYEKVI